MIKPSDFDMTDYRELLKSYMQYVGEQEGIDFLGLTYTPGIPFSEDEWNALKKISNEINNR